MKLKHEKLSVLHAQSAYPLAEEPKDICISYPKTTVC